MNLRAVFCELRSIENADERARLMDERCAGDQRLKHQLEGLFVAAALPATNPLDRAGKVLGAAEHFAITEDYFSAIDLDEAPMIGPYKLLEQIGEGGMGVVYVAQQNQPIRRKVALKLIKPGMDSKQVVARFEAERQALAMMNHANIAKVLDAGTTETGLPYFVMELVKGIPITEFCDNYKLDLRERLKLFVTVCGAVQHAHQKGIIHRDLKPSNILVELEDVRAVPKVIDFGVAKAMQQLLFENSVYTGLSQMIGTPLYMSPEQAGQSSLDVDTRSDVYSLGVLLYELLTGATPFDRESLRKFGLDEMRRIVREVDPERPSDRITTLAAAKQSTVADRLNMEDRSLRRALRGELDWIVMKTLEKDRNRRYESASGLAADIQRHLDDEPVEACPPSATYQFRKYVKQRRALFATAGLVMATLLIATAISVAFAFQAERARREGLVAQRLAERRLAQSRADFERAMKSLNMVVSEVSSPKFATLPEGQRIRDKIIEQSLEHYQQIVNAHNNDPYARLQQALAYLRLGKILQTTQQARGAQAASDQALTILNSLHVEEPENPEVLINLVTALSDRVYTAGISQADRLASAQRALELMAQVVNSGRTEDFQHYAALHSMLGNLLPADSSRAKSLFDQSLQLSKVHGFPTDPTSAIWLARRAAESKEFEQAEKLYREGIETFKAAAHLSDTWQHHNGPWWASKAELDYGRLLERLGRPAEAEAIYRDAVAITTDLVLNFGTMGHYRASLAASIQALLQLLVAQDRDREIDNLLGQVEEAIQDPVIRAEILTDALISLGQRDRALDIANDAIEKNPLSGFAHYTRARIFLAMEQTENAIADLNKSAVLATKDPLRERFIHSHGDLFFRTKQYAQAIKSYSASIEMNHDLNIKRRAYAYFRMQNYGACIADLKEALARLPEDLSSLTSIPAEEIALCSDPEFREAYLLLVDQTLELNAHAEGTLLMRAVIHCGFGQWEQAVSICEAILASPDATLIDIYGAALVALKSSDLPKYKKLCQRILQVSSDSGEQDPTYWVAWTCALSPAALEDYGVVIERSLKFVARQKGDRPCLIAHGAILMRAGQYEAAKVFVERAFAAPSDTSFCAAYEHLIMAMIKHHLKDEDAAAKHLQIGRSLAEAELSKAAAWNRKLTLELLQQEAESLLGVDLRAPGPRAQDLFYGLQQLP